MIAQATKARLMPPWKAEPGSWRVHRSPAADRRRDRPHRAVGGRGRSGRRSAAICRRRPQWTDGWQLGRPGLTVSFPEPFVVPADGPDFSRIFVLRLPVDHAGLREGLRVPAGQRRRRASCQHPDRSDAALTRTRRRRSGARIQRPAARLPPSIRTAISSAGLRGRWRRSCLTGLAWRLTSRHRSRRRNPFRPERKDADGSARCRPVLHRDPPTRTPAMLRLGRQDIEIPAGEKALRQLRFVRAACRCGSAGGPASRALSRA